MKASHITYQETNHFSPTVIRYLDKDPGLHSFLSYWPTLDGFSELLKYKPIKANRDCLVSVLKKQYADIEKRGKLHLKVQANIASLHSDNTFTVTTGHQLNLFTGPLYFIFKIVSAIKLAEELASQFPDKNFVPIYWMATEDHDFEEINHAYIHGQKITWEHDAQGATGQLELTHLEQTIKTYTSALDYSEHTQKLIELITEAYTQHATLAEATRYLVNNLFEAYGLVIIDANHPDLKKEFASILLQDIIEQNSFRLISESKQKLRAIDIQAQVNPREINFFYLLPNFRERLIFKDDRYWVLNSDISFTEQELKAEIVTYPEHFSPNVVMRPIYQELILPNIAYIGGGAEISYWLQLKATFDHYKIEFPILVLRNSASIISEKMQINLKQLDLQILDAFTDIDTLQKEWIIHHTKHQLNLNNEWQDVEILFEKIKMKASQISPTLEPSAAAVKARLYKMISSLEKKLIRAEKRNYEEALSKIKSIKNELFPNEGLEERLENFGSYYAKYGPDFIELLIENFHPLDFKFTILQETPPINHP